MSAADFTSEDYTWPAKPDGDMVPILEASIDAEQAEHTVIPADAVTLTQADRCDSACGAAAVYRVQAPGSSFAVLDYCGHHWRKNQDSMPGWTVVGVNPALIL